MNTVLDRLKIEVEAQGEALAYLEQNAIGTPAEGAEQVFPDPLKTFAECVNAGFAIPTGQTNQMPFVQIESTRPDMASHTQYWQLSIRSLEAGYLRVIDNLLRAPGIDKVRFTVLDGPAPYWKGQVLDASQYAYPVLNIKPPFAMEMAPPVEDHIPRSRTIQIEFSQPLEKMAARNYCASLDLWSEIVMRSGFAPIDIHPKDGGTIPSLAYQYDPRTIETSFEQIFIVDDACFESLKAYCVRIHQAGAGIELLRIE